MYGARHELDTPELRTLLDAVTPRLQRFLAGLERAPADGTRESSQAPEFGPPAESASDLEPLLDAVQGAMADAAETAGPRYFGYIPGGGLPSSAVGELIARVANRFTGIADLAPSMVALENSVLRWCAAEFGLPTTAGGILTTGGSQAMLSMVVAAREHHLDKNNIARGRIYLSDQAHRSVQKAAHIAGFPRSAIRLVPTSDGRRIDPGEAKRLIDADRDAGYEPFLLVGSAGTTNTGSVDPLDELATLASDEGLWFHADGCYGGFFQLTNRGRVELTGIERSDSISLDPHKSLFLPYGTGALLVRDTARLAAAHSDEDPADYLQDLADTGLADYADHSSELTREYRGLRVWLPLHLHGVAAFRDALNEKLDLARHAHDMLAKHPALDVLEQPELSTVVFRLRDGDDAANRALFEKVSASGEFFWSSTRLDGRFTLRLCILSFRTHQEHVDEAVEEIVRNLPDD